MGTRSGRGRGWCSDPQCRKAEKEEREAEELAKKAALQEQRSAKGAGSRGPVPIAANREARRQQLQAERAEEGMGSRGFKPKEDNREKRRQQLQAERAEEGMGSRGPKPIATEVQQQGYPFPDEDVLTSEKAQANYLAFTRSWGRFGLSRVCDACHTFTTGKYCRPTKQTGKMLCKNCREKTTKIILPALAPIPEALRNLRPLEQHLIAMGRISQVLLDKLPAGGPSAQWGRMYAVLMEDPLICDVLEGASLEDDGTIFVEGVQGMTPSPARLDAVHRALQELKAQHRLYKANPAVDNILARMAAIQNQEAPQGRQTGESGGSHSSALGVQALQAPHEEGEGELEVQYLIPKEFRVPKPETLELQKARGISALSDDMDTKFFPHLFPTGTGGWQNDYGSFSQYSRKRLLGLDPRFEASAPYIMWLLEMHTKKRLSGNINVRISSQQAPQAKSRYHEGKSQVFTALRDIPGTHPYVHAKKGVALNMYEQLGAPKFFLTLSCNARQPDILIAVISARLLRLRPASPPEEIECEAAEILQRYQSDEKFTWDGLSPNQLCNQHPAIVSRQFMHQVSQLMWWLGAKRDAPSHLDQNGDAQDEPEEQSEDFLQAPATDSAGRPRGVRKEHPPFRVLDYIIRIEWQKRGYPHAHILLWVEEWETKERGGPKDAEKAKEQEAPASIPKHEKKAKPAEKAPDPDWSDEEAMKEFVPKSAEDWSDKYICTKSTYSWRASAKISPRDREVNAQLATLVVHYCTEYCSAKTFGACRFGFPHSVIDRTRRRTSQEKYANSQWKSSLVTRRKTKADKNMGQYNITILRRWRASMDLQVICELTSASRYILGYAMKSEQDRESQRRVESIIANLTSGNNEVMGNQQVYKAAHAALQGRTTSTFEACHLLLGFPVVEFSRDNQWIQVGSPASWTLSVPNYEEGMALGQPEAYRSKRLNHDGYMPVAQKWYRETQRAFSHQEEEVPVEGGQPVKCRFGDMIFLDFCAAFKFIGVNFPQPRRRPAIVAYRNFSPDQEPEEFYFSRLLLYLVWREPGDWLQEADGGSHAAAFRRIAQDVEGHPNFLQSRCFPRMDGTLEAARKLQAVQATMYMKAKIHPAHLRDGWANSKVAQENYEDSMKILEALKERHGDEIDFMAPDHVPTGAAGDAFAPVEGGQECFEMLTVEDPSPETQHQRRAMEYIIQTVLNRPNTKDANNAERLNMLLHGPGGCGKSVVVRGAAHMLRQGGIGAIIAAPTGVAAWNINGVTLHSCCLLPVVNQSYGKACDVPLPNGPLLETLRSIWNLVSVLFVDEISFISSFMLERIDQHLRLARDMPRVPFGGLHVIFAGDLYQLPPPGGLPAFASQLWLLFQLCELEGNQRAAKDPEWAAILARIRVGKWTEEDIQRLRGMKSNSNKQPAPKAVHLYPTRRAVAESNRLYIEDHINRTGAKLYESPALDINVKTGAPLTPELVWADPENTGGLEALFRVAIGARVMLRHNLDIQDGLVNGACGFVENIDADENTGEIERIWVDFEKDAGAKWCAENETSFVAITRRSATYLDTEGSKASRLQFPMVLAKATTIHKSQAATLHDGAHCRLDATCKEEGQAYVALSRCPSQALCTLEFFNPKSLRFNANAEWALTKLKAQQAGRDGSHLWKQLFRPAASTEYYEARLAELGNPDWSKLKKDKDEEQQGERPWHCPHCGEEVPNTQAAIKAHRRKCTAKPKGKAKGKSKASNKANSATKPEAKAKAKAAAKRRPLLTAALLRKRSADEPSSGAPPPKLAKTNSPERSTAGAKAAKRGSGSEQHGEEQPANAQQVEAASCYFERQVELRCGIHALNNALGARHFDVSDLEQAVAAFLEENWELGDDANLHMGPGGDYSIEVLLMAVRTKAMQAFDRLCWEMSDRRALRAEDLNECLGAIQNRNGRHWVALKHWGDSGFLYLDSMKDGPTLLSHAELEASLQQHPTYSIREV